MGKIILLILLALCLIISIWDYLKIVLLVVGILVFPFIIRKAIEKIYMEYAKNHLETIDFILEKRRYKQEQREINKMRKKAENEKKKSEKVARLGKLGHSLDVINQEFEFSEVVHKEVVEYKTVEEYENFDKKSYFFTCYPKASETFTKLCNNASQNREMYREYTRKFFACKDFTSKREIKHIPKRGMSVKKFQELEQKLFPRKVKAPPNTKVAMEITIKYQEKKNLIVVYEAELQRLLQEIKNEREYNFVCSNSLVYQELHKLNGRYHFYDIKVPNFCVECTLYSEYQKFDIRKHACQWLKAKQGGLENLYNQAVANKKLYDEYKKLYMDLSRYLLTEEAISKIKDMPMRVVDFQMLENKIYSQMLLEEPIVAFSIPYNVEYTSPAGRNYYEKEECLTCQEIGDIIREIEREEIERQEFEIEKKRLRQQREEQRAVIRDLLRNKNRLEQKELELEQRELEFKRATKGHIYAVSEIPVLVDTEQVKERVAKDEALSVYERMKQLKKAYANGEITYEEYSEKRNKLL